MEMHTKHLHAYLGSYCNFVSISLPHCPGYIQRVMIMQQPFSVVLKIGTTQFELSHFLRHFSGENMSKKQELMLKAFKGFEGDKPRRLLHEGEWYFSVVDTVEVLTDQPTIQRAQLYWRVLKKRIKAESVTNCNDLIQLKQTASDGKRYLTDMANIKTLLRIIQSIPSPKAEPFKQWLASLGDKAIKEEHARRNGHPAIVRDETWLGIRAHGKESTKDLAGYIDENLPTHEKPTAYPKVFCSVSQQITGKKPVTLAKELGLKDKTKLRNYQDADTLFCLDGLQRIALKKAYQTNAQSCENLLTVVKESAEIIKPVRIALGVYKPKELKELTQEVR